MPITPQTDVWIAAVNHRIGGSRLMSCVFRVGASWGAMPVTVAQDVANAWTDESSINALQSNDVTYDSFSVAKVNDPLLTTVFPGSLAINAVGDITGDQVASQVALIVTKVSGVGGRKGKGRFYIPGVASSLSGTDNLGWQGSLATTFQDACDNFLQLLQTGDVTQQLMLPNGTSSDPIPVSELQPRLYYGTQRRRAKLG